MKRTERTEKQGRVPGDGKSQKTVSRRPDDPGLVSRAQLKELVGVSNSTVITKAIERLSIGRAEAGSKSIDTYNHGGWGPRAFEVPYYHVSATQAIREELERRAQPIGSGRHSYDGVTFRWKRGGLTFLTTASPQP